MKDNSVVVVAQRADSADEFTVELWEVSTGGAPARLLAADALQTEVVVSTNGDIVYVRQTTAGVALVRLRGNETTTLALLPAAPAALRAGPDGAIVAGVREPIVDGIPAYGAALWQGGQPGPVLYRPMWPNRVWASWARPHRPCFVIAHEGSVTFVSARADVAVDDFDVLGDGRVIAIGYAGPPADRRRSEVLAIRPDDGAVEVLLSLPGQHLREIRVAPDGVRLAMVVVDFGSPDQCHLERLDIFNTATDELRTIVDGDSVWPRSPVWDPNSDAVLFITDRRGNSPILSARADGGVLRDILVSGAAANLCIDPATGQIHAAWSTVSSSPRTVSVEAGRPIDRFVPDDDLDVREERVVASANDGVVIESWLVTPSVIDEPLPVLVLLHGGPLVSWTEWSWRCNAALLASIGYAVLLPDPSLSVGYGRSFIERGWGRWGERHHLDVTAAVEAILDREDVDRERLGLFGASFGGYLVNWIVAHDDRYRAAVSHAGIWSLDTYCRTSDVGYEPERQFGTTAPEAEAYKESSPSTWASGIATPMLLVHGGCDYRVPEGESLALWRHLSGTEEEHRFVYFPEEGHWISRPSNIQTWYRLVIAFFDRHLRGGPPVEEAVVDLQGASPGWR